MSFKTLGSDSLNYGQVGGITVQRQALFRLNNMDEPPLDSEEAKNDTLAADFDSEG